MQLIHTEDLSQVSGGIASISGGFSMGPNGFFFQPGCYITVTGSSSNILGNFAAYSDKVVDLSTNEVLFDGSQSSFCINGSTFSVSPTTDGHVYTYIGNC